MVVNLCHSIRKFSHATGTRPDGTFAWTHIIAENMSIVVQGADPGRADAEVALRVIQNNHQLEHVEIGVLVDLDCRDNRNNRKLSDRHIYGVVQEPRLALTYRQNDGQIRRVQFTFHSDENCKAVVDILHLRGLSLQRPPLSSAQQTISTSKVASQSSSLDLENRIANIPMTLEHEIPSRRELPFSRPGSRMTGSGKSTSRPSSSNLVPRPPSQPIWSNNISKRTLTSASSNANLDLDLNSSLKRPFSAMEGYHGQKNVREYAHETPTRESFGVQTTSDQYTAPPSRQPCGMNELLYGDPQPPIANIVKDLSFDARSEHSQRPNATPLTSGTFDLPQIVSTNDGSPTKQSNSCNEDCGARMYTALSSSFQDGMNHDLHLFAAQSSEDRRAALDSFMMTCIRNPDFAQLCEDVENCWRRALIGVSKT